MGDFNNVRKDKSAGWVETSPYVYWKSTLKATA
jgi:hypothetical protein